MIHLDSLMVLVLDFEFACLVEFLIDTLSDDFGFRGEFHFVIIKHIQIHII